jgi:hypothetical protein
MSLTALLLSCDTEATRLLERVMQELGIGLLAAE